MQGEGRRDAPKDEDNTAAEEQQVEVAGVKQSAGGKAHEEKHKEL